MSSLRGNALLTGASGGIGQAIARALAAQGASLVLTGRRAEVLEPLAKELDGRAVVCDLAQRAELDRLLAAVADVDILIANAALPASGILNEFDQGQVDRILEVNLRAPIALAHALAPAMVARKRGHLVFIGSLAGKAASPASSMYSATKFGLRGFVLGLREDLRPHGVGVSTVLPGFIREAGMFADAGVKLPWWVRTRSPQDVAEAVIRAIRADQLEVEVAPIPLRFGASFATVAPVLGAALSRRLGSERIALQHVEGQREKR